MTRIIEETKSPRVIRNKLNKGKAEITKLQNERGQITSNREQKLKIVEDFYTKLYRNQSPAETSENIPHILNQRSEEMPTITEEKVLKSLSEMKNNKAPGVDGIVVEAIK